MAEHDVQDELHDPWCFQAPGWVQKDGHDLRISPEKPDIHDELQVVLDAEPLGSDHALLRERGNRYATHVPIFPGYTQPGQPRSITTRSYFGAALMALFNLSPFLNFIEEAVISKHFNDPILVGLHSLAQIFHRRGHDRLGAEDLKKEVRSRTEILWNCIKTRKSETNDPEIFKETACHVPEFINYLLQRLEHAQPLQDEAGGGDDVNMSTRFKQLFKHSFVRLTPMRCSCPQRVLRRQPTRLAQSPGYIFQVIITEGMHLEQAISQAMWVEEDKSSTRTCPECGDEVHASDFNTFAYLPEVFFILPHFMSKRYSDGYVRYTYDEKFVYPERLDMSGLADDPQRPGDQVDSVYKLQSIITCSNQNMDKWTDYRSALRVNENEFVQYGYGGTDFSTTTYTTFEDINDPNSRQIMEEAPHILMYVRDRHSNKFGTVPDAVKHRQFPPDPNTNIHDMYGLESSHLERFVEAQKQPGEDGNGTMFESARSELGQGHRTSHWMWFMFPHIFGTSPSRLGEFYAIKSLGEAIAYWKHPELKRRYLDLLNIVLESSETDPAKLFGSWIDAFYFEASLTLFALTCSDEERDAFEQAFRKFSKTEVSKHTVKALYDWLHYADEDRAIAWMHHYVKTVPDHRSDKDDGNQKAKIPERGGLSILVTSPKALAYNVTQKDAKETEPGPASGNGNVTDPVSIAGKSLYTELMKLSETELPEVGKSDEGKDAERVADINERAVQFGKLLLGYAVPKGAAAPAETPEFLEKARRMGRNLMQLTRLPEKAPGPTPEGDDDMEQVDGAFDHAYDGADDELALGHDFETYDAFIPEDGYEALEFRTSADGYKLDSSSDELAEDSYRDERYPHEAIAIPSDPNDPRIGESEAWTLNGLKLEFQKEQLDQRGLRNDHKKHRMKFLKHFELERDYSIYHESRLRQAVKEKGIVMIRGVDKADKAELVDALTEYDTQRLGEMEFVGEDIEQTDSAGFEAEEYQSSEAPEANRSSSSEETPRPKKRHRDEYEEEQDDFIDDEYRDGDYGEEDYYDGDDGDDGDDGETVSRGPPKGPVRVRTRY